MVTDNVPDYDAGLLNDFGGGDVGWWQDYLRAEIGRANDHWRAALTAGNAETPDLDKWSIDNSTASPILMYEKCSVIQDEQAHFVLGLIRSAGNAEGLADPVSAIMQYIEDTMAEATVDYPAGREAGPRVEYDSDGIDRRIRSALLPRQPEGWRDMGSAPKDGTHILAKLHREAAVDMDDIRRPAFTEIREIWYRPYMAPVFGHDMPWHAGDPFDSHDGMAPDHFGADVPIAWMPLPKAEGGE
jgi:hypothetical protein